MFVRNALIALSLASLAAAGCEQTPPSTVAEWITAYGEAKTPDDQDKAAQSLRELALKQLREGVDLSEAVAPLVAAYEAGEASDAGKQELATALGALGDKAAVKPLIASLDYSAGVADGAAQSVNNAAARALGALGDKAAVKPLVKLMRNRERTTALAAVQALGALGDSGAVAPLREMAEDEAIDPFLTKNAIIALGDIGDAAATPTLLRMLFSERQGISFYRESSLALFQMDQDISDKLIDALLGKDAELNAFAKERKIFDWAITAKAAQVLGDLGEPKAIPALLKRLDFTHEAADAELVPRMMAAEALGRLRAKAAAPKLAARLAETDDSNARAAYARALARVGDAKVISTVEKAATSGENFAAREEAQWLLARLDISAARFDKVTATNGAMSTCASWFNGPKAKIEAACAERIEAYKKKVELYRPMLAAAEECKEDPSCWAGKLSDPSDRVRERAAWSLSAVGTPAQIEALNGAAQDKNDEVRLAVFHAFSALLFGADGALAEVAGAEAVAARLEAILADERGSARYLRINEDTKRLAIALRKALAKAKG